MFFILLIVIGLKKFQSETAIKTQKISPTSVVYEIPAGWKTYTDNRLGYSIGYPDSYILSKESYSNDITQFSDGKNSFRVGVYRNSDTYYKKRVEMGRKSFGVTKDINVDGVKGKVSMYEALGDTFNKYELITVETNENIYELYAETQDNDQEGMDDFRTAVTTFRFVNK